MKRALALVALLTLALTGCQSAEEKANACATEVHATYSPSDEDSLLTQTLDQCGEYIRAIED